jgi:hypothetical protein
MKTSGITAALLARDPGRAKAFYIERVGLQAVESHTLEASDGRVGLMVGDGVNTSSSILPRRGRRGNSRRPSFRSATCALPSKR